MKLYSGRGPAFAILLLFTSMESPVLAADIHDAARKGDADAVLQMLADGVPIDEKNGAGETALYLAAKKGQIATVQALIERGADINTHVMGQMGSEGTALHVAIKWGHLDAVSVLLDAGGDPNHVDRDAGPPLHMAVFRNRKEIEALLRERGAKEVTAEPVDTLIASASIEAGRKIAGSCSVCHAMEKDQEQPSVGPALWEILQRPVASQEGFSYSKGLRRLEGRWNYEMLNNFIHAPKGFAPGTKMSFSGIPEAERRAPLIAYLRTLSDSPVPLP